MQVTIIFALNFTFVKLNFNSLCEIFFFRFLILKISLREEIYFNGQLLEVRNNGTKRIDLGKYKIRVNRRSGYIKDQGK